MQVLVPPIPTTHTTLTTLTTPTTLFLLLRPLLPLLHTATRYGDLRPPNLFQNRPPHSPLFAHQSDLVCNPITPTTPSTINTNHLKDRPPRVSNTFRA